MVWMALAAAAEVRGEESTVVEGAKNPINLFELPEVEVVGITPIATSGLTRDKVPGNVQSAEDEDIARHESLTLSDFLFRQLESVNINDEQNNPFQPNVTYRGFEASPLLGTPIGISVYQDGVRVNEPFGDTVNWDLIPRSAIANIDLIPGSNPLFGLNTLGGALSVRTKSGAGHPGSRGQIYGGSFGRKAFEMEHGGSAEGFDWFFTGNVFEDDGWRPYSHSAVHQAFGKVGWEDDATDIDLSFTFADNGLNGVGPTPESFLEKTWRAIYTAPDTTNDALYFVNLQGSHWLTDELELAGNAYFRNSTIGNFNSNIGEGCASFDNDEECLDEEGNLLPAAANAQTRTGQIGQGTNVQANSTYKVLGLDNRFMVGGGYNAGQTHFTQETQPAIFSPTRYTLGSGPFEQDINLQSDNEYFNAFATDTLSVLPWLNLNAAVSWNRAQINLKDRLGTALNGNHLFERFNPSAGFTVNPTEELTFYGNYNQGFRAPSPVELTCADPAAPCSLPNSFVADPPLKPVVSETFEIGARGYWTTALRWNAALYHTRLNNDILFVNSSGLINGYFQNVGATQRQGGEVGLQGVWEKLTWKVNYSFIDATFQTDTVLGNPLGPVPVQKGDRIPSIPQQLVKLGAEYEILEGWFFGGDLQFASSQYVRGDYNNQLPQVPEYAIVNLNTRYVVTKNVEVFAMARNVFDTRYENYGVVNQNFFTGQPERFLGPGAPIGGWGGIRVMFD